MNRLPIHRILLFGILFALAGYGLWSEKIPVNNHTGWDGKHYANLTIHFEELAAQKQIDSYQYQRIITPAILFYTTKLAGIPLHQGNIVLAFSIYNFLLILLCSLIFFNLCSSLNLSTATEIIGFSCLFLNYCILKNTSYYPVLTDTTAFFFGFLLVYLFVRNRQTLLYGLVLLGQFCYPMLLVVSAPLALNLRNNFITNALQRLSFYKIISIALIVLLLIGFYNILWVPDTILPKYKMELNTFLLPLSIAGVVCYIWKSISIFSGLPTQHSEKFFFMTLLFNIFGLISFMFVSHQLISKISIPEDVFTPTVFLNNVLQQSIDNPLVFIVAHCIYLGPGILLLILFYKPFVQTITAKGDSAIVYVIAAIIFSIGSETRQFIHFYPFIIIMLMITLNPYRISVQTAKYFALLSLITSKVWLPINTPESFTQYLYAQFPDQYYFMNHGPFMSDTSYLINITTIIIELIIVWFLIIKRKNERVIAG